MRCSPNFQEGTSTTTPMSIWYYITINFNFLFDVLRYISKMLWVITFFFHAFDNIAGTLWSQARERILFSFISLILWKKMKGGKPSCRFRNLIEADSLDICRLSMHLVRAFFISFLFYWFGTGRVWNGIENTAATIV